MIIDIAMTISLFAIGFGFGRFIFFEKQPIPKEGIKSLTNQTIGF